MKKLISVILALVLILASMPLTAAANQTSIEQKLRLLLEDMELDPAYSVDRLLYEEKAQYPAQDPEWVLIRAELIPEGSAAVTDGRDGVFGNKIIRSQPYTCVPFALGWGVFDVKSNAFYDLIDAWDMGFDSLHEIWNGLKSDGAVKLIGDADGDGALSILDATRIQRVLVDLESEPHELYEQLDQSDFVHGYPIGCVSDYDRDGSLTILDATKIQRGIAGLPNMIDFKTSVNERADKEGVHADLDARLLTDTELFSAFCSSYLTGDLAARILAAYPDDYFRTGALIGIYDYLPGGSDTLTPRSLSLGNGAVLTVDLLLGKSQPDLDGTADENPRFILLEISKAFTDEISDVQLNVTAEKETSSIITEIPYYSQITASTPDDLNSAGYKKVAGEELTVTYRGRAYYEFDGPLNYTQTGYVMLLRSRKDFEHYLPEFDKEGALDDAFFNDYAVLAMLQHGGAGEAYAVLSDIAVYNDTTLWCSSRIDYNYWYIDPDTPALSPTDPVVWTFVKIKQSDVKNVNALAFWKAHEYDPDIDYEYTVNDSGDVEITKYIGDQTQVTVPSSIDGKKVVAIGDKAFQLSKVESVTLPDTVTKIGEKAFASCTYLTSITIPDSVTSIGSQAFYYCSALADLTMSKNVTSIGSYAFYACNSIESFAIPKGVTRINYATFSYCTGLKSITMSDNVTYIGEQAFYRCNALLSIRLSSSVQTIEASAFEKCISLKVLSIPRTCKTFGSKAAKDCTALESVYFANESLSGFELLPIENDTIGSSAFEGCTALTDVSMPDTVKTIGSRAFFGCTSLGEFDLPGSVTEIGADTFNGCESLTAVRQNKSGDLTVRTVGDYAFRGCAALKHIRFTDSLTSIGDAAFRGCTSLSTLDLKENLKTIGTDAFLECDALKKLTVPRSVTSISSGALGYTVDDTNHYVKRTDFTIRGYLNSKAHTYATQYSIPFEAIDEADDIFSTLITDDKKVAEGTYGVAVEYENLPTGVICFKLDYKYGNDLSVFTGQPFRVAIIRSYDEYQRFFSTAYFEEYDTAYEPKGAVYMSVDANDEGQPLPEDFFTDNALIVGVGTFSLGSGRLTFDEIRRMENGELVIRFNSLTADDLNHGAPYAAPILGYEFAAAQVSQEVVRNVQSVLMLPQVKNLPDDI